MTFVLGFKAKVGKPWLRASLPASDGFLRFKHLPTINDSWQVPSPIYYLALGKGFIHRRELHTQILDEFDKRKITDSKSSSSERWSSSGVSGYLT